jgi:UDP:flavonoid glycosyltransferase YjiC (YdhE family)
MRVLLATTRGAGHARPLLPFAHACRDAGHDVLLAGPPPVGGLAEREGLAFAAVGQASPRRLADVRGRLEGLALEARLRVAANELFVHAHGRAALPAMLALVERWRPDVVLRETAEVASLLAAEAADVPVARVGIALSTSNEDRWLAHVAQAVEPLRAELGLPPDPEGRRARRVPVLTQAPPALDGPPELRPAELWRYRVAGAEPAPPLPDWWQGSEAPLVAVSFGTVVPTEGHYPGLYRAVIDAMAELELRVLVTVGERADPAALGTLPQAVHVERWLPQRAVGPHAAAMVTHGGAGTTLLALADGVPMVLLPLTADQPLNARQMDALGTGIALEGGPDDVVRIPDALRRILHEPRFGAAARDVADEIHALPPVADCVHDLEALAERRLAAHPT